MPKVNNVPIQKYNPTPVPLQLYRKYTPSDIKNETQYSVTPPPTPPRIEQKPGTPRNKTKPNSKNKPVKQKWSRKKKIIVGLIVATIVLLLIIAAILLGVLLTRNSNTTTTTSTTQSTTVIIAYWTFDAVVNDYYGVYNGTLNNSASYFSTSTNQPFVGYGRGLTLTSSSSQLFSVTTPFLDLSYKSFTIEAWIYPILSSSTDYGIFGQCSCQTCSNQCLYWIIRNYRLYISFTNNDLIGNTTLTSSTWYHIAFVYNYATSQQILYVNGGQDAIKSSASSYQGLSGPLLIGASQMYLVQSYYNGYIDNFKITTRAKSATEILNAATLAAYYPFDLPNPTYDSGPNGLNGSLSNAVIISGRVNQGIRFTGSTSYFQAYGFYQLGFTVIAAKPFSVSLWISPSVAITCAIVQISPYLSSYCHNLLGLFTTLSVTAQIVIQGYSWPILYGPVTPLNTWTHISITYGTANGLTLYTNGVRSGYTGAFSFGAPGAISYLQLGYYTGCSSAYITNTAYQGSIDEVYAHSRELSQSEVAALANP